LGWRAVLRWLKFGSGELRIVPVSPHAALSCLSPAHC